MEETLTLLPWLRSVWGLIKLGAVLLHASVELLVKRPTTRLQRAMWLHRLCRRAVRIFGVATVVDGHFPTRGVLISNHLSYLEIVVYASIQPCVFVAKAEIERWPLLGWMTTMAGTVYVQRGRGGSAREAGSGLRAAADAGLPVVFFPEGTTSDGELILKFHSGLLGEALEGQLPVTAAYLQYTLAEANRGRTVRDDVAYWGDGSMVKHVARFLGLRGVRAHVTIASSPIRFVATGVSSRKLAAIEARRAMCELSETCRVRPEEIETPA